MKDWLEHETIRFVPAIHKDLQNLDLLINQRKMQNVLNISL